MLPTKAALSAKEIKELGSDLAGCLNLIQTLLRERERDREGEREREREHAVATVPQARMHNA